MLKNLFTAVIGLSIALSSYAQKKDAAEIKTGYKFTPVTELKATSVKDQASTKTCWSFATTSFIESELLRMGKGEYDLSEMYIVRYNYIDKLHDNFLKQGNGNLGQGSLSHDWMIEFTVNGIVPDEVYTGQNFSSQNELNSVINAIGKVAVDRRIETDLYKQVGNEILDTYLGEVPESFIYKGVRYTPKSFASSLGINPEDYVEITSFTHYPFYSMGLVPVPDNWRKVNFYNVPLNELISIMNYSLKNGFTLAWDGDVSEAGFSHWNSVAIIPETNDKNSYSSSDLKKFGPMTEGERSAEAYSFSQPFPEMNITQDLRQKWFEDESTTDDHLMHVTGLVTDQNGKTYYVTKNSWGAGSNSTGGYLNMSENYVRAKTIYIMVHKNAVPEEIRKKLGF
ncbi:MAG TPA: C1 family peptidase [Bacteroidales bacterium]|nr:C1 family peptidase [Bacteroidales bacterium]